MKAGRWGAEGPVDLLPSGVVRAIQGVLLKRWGAEEVGGERD